MTTTEQAMSTYDENAWADVQAWRLKRREEKERSVLKAVRDRVPMGVREQAASIGRSVKDRVDDLPGAEAFQGALLDAIEGLTSFATKAALASVRESKVVDSYRGHGHDVGEVEEIRNLALADIDKVRPRLDLAYAAVSAAQGAASGLVAGGGTLVATAGGVASAGAAAAPGAGTVVAAMAADAIAVLASLNRVVGHTGAYYGYNVEEPAEAIFALSVLGMGVAGPAGKAAAYIELNKVVQNLARNQSWEVLNKSVVTKVVKQVYARLGMNITKDKLGQAVPVLGIVLGAGLNAKILNRVADDAYWLYRERFLVERYGLTVDLPNVPTDESPDDVLSVGALVDAELDTDAGLAVEDDRLIDE
jgi:hypothetical protein